MFLIKNLKHLFSILLLFLLIGFPDLSNAQLLKHNSEEPDSYTKAGLIANKTQVKGGETIRVGLAINIHPAWHIYWKNPGDSGTPPEINWDLPPGFSISPLEFPVPKKLPYGPLTNYGHENYAVLLQNLTLPAEIPNSAFMLKAKVNLLVCHDICIPENHDVSILLNGDNDPFANAIDVAQKMLPIQQNWPATYREDEKYFYIDVIVENTSDFNTSKKVNLFPEEWGAVDNNKDAFLEITDTGFTLKQKRGERDLNEISELSFVVDTLESAEKAINFQLTATPSQKTSTPLTGSNIKGDSGFGLMQALLFALIGGLILNLMPCVFPVLSMKALSLINLKSKEEEKARHYGLSYTAGILVSFGIIAGFLLTLKAGGAQIGWGFQLQSPVIIIFLTYLVFIVGLNFSGLFEFSGRFSNIGSKLAQQSGNKGAFFTGVLATLVATPCTAPFMGAAMGFALTQPAYISMLVFLALGLGLALPYLALCFIPSLRSKLPKPGAWMETFRQFLAFPMFITTAWLIWVLSQQVGSIDILCVTLSLIAIVFVIWLAKVLPANGFLRGLSKLLIMTSLVFVVALPFLPKTGGQTINAQGTEQNWDNFTPDILSNLLESTDEPIFTNMTAAWCITCKVNEKIALSTQKAKTLFAEKNIQYLKGDWTNQNPEITQYLNSFDRQGVPLYVYYGARDDQSGKRPEPVVLPQILTPGLVEKTIQN